MDEKRWYTFNLAEQMGNIGSELTRAQSFKQVNDIEQFNNSLSRALEMIEVTLKDQRYAHRLRELKIIHDIVVNLRTSKSPSWVSLDDLIGVLLPFALVARR